jgi:hypothetical protein
VYAFVEQMCSKYGIDKSHDVDHAKDCVQFATQLLDDTITDEQRTVILYAAAVHDTVDKKYVPIEQACSEVRSFFETLGLEPRLIQAILAIITTMSYSYLVKRRAEGLSFPDHGPWQTAYHIVRHADLLCAYRVERCFQYQKHIMPEISDADAMIAVRKIFDNRVFKYISDGWLTLPKAVMIAGPLVNAAYVELGRD